MTYPLARVGYIRYRRRRQHS